MGAELGDDMVEARVRSVNDGYGRPALVYDEYDVNIRSGWEDKGRVALRQTEPVPTTILGVTREFDYGGR